MSATATFGDLTVNLNEKYSVENIKKFISEITSGDGDTSVYRDNPIDFLSGMGIEVSGDVELTREKALKAMGKDGFPGVLDGNLSAKDGNTLIGPAIVFVIIVLYPR